MPRKDLRLVQSRDTSVFTSSSRVQEEEIQVFNLPGEVFDSISGHWSPQRDVVLTSWTVTSSTRGTGGLWVVLLVGDHAFNVEGDGVGVMILPAANLALSSKITLTNSIYNYATVTTNQWMAIQLGGSTGHSDVTVQLYGKYL